MAPRGWRLNEQSREPSFEQHVAGATPGIARRARTVES